MARGDFSFQMVIRARIPISMVLVSLEFHAKGLLVIRIVRWIFD